MKCSASESVYLERLSRETRLWSEFGTALVQTLNFIRAEPTISKSVFWPKWVVLSFLVNLVAQDDFIFLRLEWKYKTRTFLFLESVIFTLEIESSQCLGECMYKQDFFESNTHSCRWGFFLAFPFPILCKCDHFNFLRFKL